MDKNTWKVGENVGIEVIEPCKLSNDILTWIIGDVKVELNIYSLEAVMYKNGVEKTERDLMDFLVDNVLVIPGKTEEDNDFSLLMSVLNDRENLKEKQ